MHIWTDFSSSSQAGLKSNNEKGMTAKFSSIDISRLYNTAISYTVISCRIN
jgi:hypothetical protein